MSAELTTTDEPDQQPISTKTRIILIAIERLDDKLTDLQNVSEAVREIQQTLRLNNSWRGAIFRALKHFLSLIELAGDKTKK